MEKSKRRTFFPLFYILVIELVIQIAARLISSDGGYFTGQPSNAYIYNIMEIVIRIFFIAATVYTFIYWKEIDSKPRLFSLICDNFTLIYIAMSFILFMSVNSLCF